MSKIKSDVLFVFAPAPGNAGAFKNHLGVAYLRAALARDGMATTQYLNRNPGAIDAVAADIIRQKCPIVGFTVYDYNARLSIALARSIKQKKPETRIVFGGPTVTFNARPLMERHAVVDACIMGEAEQIGAQILSKLLDRSTLDDAQPGVAFRRDGEVICTRLPPLVGSCQPGALRVPDTTTPGAAFVPVGEIACTTSTPLVGSSQPGLQGELDSTPSPYLSGILADGQEGVLTGRGCTHRCQYCCCAALVRNRLRLHSLERVVAELESIAEHQKRTGEPHPVAIHDDAFTLLPPRAKALCQAIADRKLNLVLSCITRADTLDDELIRLMWGAGFRSLALGLESAVPSVLRAAGKVRPPDWPSPDLAPERQFVERVKKSVLLAKKRGFNVKVSIILGLPMETPADGAETLRFVKDLPLDSYVHNLLSVFPGTPLWTNHEKYGIRCHIDATGLAETTGHSYDVKTLKPGPKCNLEGEASLSRLWAVDALYGCEASSAEGTGIRTVILEADELSPRIAEWLRAILAVGGIVVHEYPAMKRNERMAKFCRDRSAFREHLIPARYYIQAWPKKLTRERDGDDIWEISSATVDVFRKHKPGLLTIRTSNNAMPLIAWAKGQEAKATVCETCECLQNPRELVQLMDRIEAEDAPCPLQRMAVPPHVKYPGRWLRGKAPCLSLTRIEVSGSGEVRCCRQGEPIGKVGDSPRILSKRLAELASAVEQRRGCAECRSTHCSRCPFPGIDDRTYCQIITRQGRTQRLLDWVSVYSRLPLLLAYGRCG